jgi:hypothetical protein
MLAALGSNVYMSSILLYGYKDTNNLIEIYTQTCVQLKLIFTYKTFLKNDKIKGSALSLNCQLT